MTAFLRASVPAAARLSTDELTFVLNQMLGLELPERLLARGQRAPCGVEVDRGGVHLLNCVRCAQVTKVHDLVQGSVRRQARGAGLTVTTAVDAWRIVVPTSRSNVMRSTRSPGAGCPSTR